MASSMFWILAKRPPRCLHESLASSYVSSSSRVRQGLLGFMRLPTEQWVAEVGGVSSFPWQSSYEPISLKSLLASSRSINCSRCWTSTCPCCDKSKCRAIRAKLRHWPLFFDGGETGLASTASSRGLDASWQTHLSSRWMDVCGAEHFQGRTAAQDLPRVTSARKQERP